MTAGKKSQSTVRVRQIRSGIGFNKKQKATLRALGLERIGRVRELRDHPSVRGMVASIPHLVVIEGEGDREDGR
jgi:large subunit ribosomal protein L30